MDENEHDVYEYYISVNHIVQYKVTYLCGFFLYLQPVVRSELP